MYRHFFILLLLLLFTGVLPSLAQQLNSPENLTAVQSGNDTILFVDLDWQSGNFPQFEMYKIYRKEGPAGGPGDFHVIGITHQSDFKDRFVHPNRTYAYHVTAFRMGQESPPSNDAVITITGAGGLTDGIVKGTVIDEATSIPLIDADVMLISTTSYNAYRFKTNPLGNYRASVYPGTYMVAFKKKMYEGEFWDDVRNPLDAIVITVAENDSVVDIDAGLSPKDPPIFHTLSGQVTDGNGNGLPSHVLVFPNHRCGHLPRPIKAFTDSDGNYFVNVVEGDTVIVTARPLDRSYLPEFYDGQPTLELADRIAITGDISNIDFTLEPAPVYPNSIEGTVASIDGQPLFAQIVAFRMDPNRPFRPFKQMIFTDSLGNYQLENLRPGKYYLLARPEVGYIPSFFRYDGTPTLNWHNADSIMVDSITTVTGADFNLLAIGDGGYASLSGMVLNSDGDVVSGAAVYAVNENDETVAYAISNSGGEYVMEDVAAGTYTVIAGDVGYEPDEANDITLDYSGNISSNVDFTLNPDSPTSVENDGITVTDFELMQNYPNPFNPSTTIRFSVPEDAQVKLIVYDITGSEVATLVEGYRSAGSYKVTFDAANLTSGVYFYRLEAADFISMKKMILMK